MMIGNYKVPGNVVVVNINAEYNAYLNSDALQNIINKISDNNHNNNHNNHNNHNNNHKLLSIIPLDCTNFAPLNIDTINDINKREKELYENNLTTNSKFIINVYDQFIKLLRTTLLTLNSQLYLWDLVNIMIALEFDVGASYDCITPKIDSSGLILRKCSNKKYGKVKLYNYLDYQKFIDKIVFSIIGKQL
jgi:inosine-uridine nucleoside N-ribohydrolase